jgi:predicted ATPase/transcriptional regulator with XRE-family HTH domain
VHPASTPPFGELLRGHRIAARLSQEQLADLARISVSAIGTLERGSRNAPQRQTLLLLMSALELGPEARAELEIAASRGRVRKRGPACASSAPIGTELPVYLTSFVGRHDELPEAAALVRAHRLVTIVGAGGTGKTRLAGAIATLLGGELEHVRFLDLARVASSEDVALHVASALGIPALEENDAPRQIATQLARTSMLLVLDNCEHVLEGAAELTVTLLRFCPALHILTTSRERLRINGEHVWHLEPLPPALALQLFVERAQDLDPRFALNASLVPVAIDVCRRLDGIPLAIELAAARLPSLGVIELRRRLDQQLALPGAQRDTPARHQTMQATIAWSYDLLDEREQRLLLLLAVFVGGFTLNAAEIVCAQEDIRADDISTLLARLVDKSMAQISRGETPRYRLLEPVRLYGLQRLAAEDRYEEAVRRHATWLAVLGDACDTELQTAGGPASGAQTVREAVADFDNVRAALGRLTSTSSHADSALAARIAGGLRGLWIFSGHFAEAQRWCERIAAYLDADSEPELYGRLLKLNVQTSYHGTELTAVQEALRFFRRTDDRYGIANSYLHLLFVLCRWDEADRIAPVFEEARVFFRSNASLSPDLHSRFFCVSGHFEALRGNFERAREEIARGSGLLPEKKSRWFVNCLLKAGEVEALAGNYDRAIVLTDEALSHESTAFETIRVGGRTPYAAYLILAGNVEAAALHLRATVRVMVEERFTDYGALSNEVVALAAVIALERGFPDEAARLKGYADATDATQYIGAPGKRLVARLDASLGQKLDPRRNDDLRRWGSQLTSEEAFERALAALEQPPERLEERIITIEPRRHPSEGSFR